MILALIVSGVVIVLLAACIVLAIGYAAGGDFNTRDAIIGTAIILGMWALGYWTGVSA